MGVTVRVRAGLCHETYVLRLRAATDVTWPREGQSVSRRDAGKQTCYCGYGMGRTKGTKREMTNLLLEGSLTGRLAQARVSNTARER